MATKITTRVLADDAVTDAKIADVTLTTATQAASDNTTKIATTAYVTTAIANLADSAPSTLNTLNELAAALGDDANYATTTTNAIAAKLPLAGGTMTGNLSLTKEDPNITLTDSSASRTLAAFVDNNNSVLRSSGQLLLQIGSTSAITIDSTKRVGVNQVPTGSNFALQVQGIQTDGTDGRAAYFKGYGTQTSIGSTGPTVVIQNANTTANNYAKLSFESGNAGETVSINAQNIDHTNHYGDMAFNTRGSGGYSEKMRILANGRVGIGTTSPTSKLHVAHGNLALGFDSGIFSSANPSDYTVGRGAGITMQNADVYTGGIYGLREASNWTGALAFYTHTSGSGNTFGSTFTEKMRITSDGNIGIGTTSPEKNLSIGSSQGEGIQFNFDTTNNYRNQILNYWNSNADSRMDFNIARTSGQTPATIMSVGYNSNVGIGTSSPGFKLTIGGGIGANQSTAYASMTGRLGFGNDYSDTQRGPNKIVLQNDGSWIAGLGVSNGATDFYSGGHFTFSTGTSLGTEKMRINSSGFVGIGADPAFLGLTGSGTSRVLHVGGTNSQLRLTNSIIHHDNAGLTKLTIRNNYGATSNSAQMELQAGFITFETGTSFTERLRINSSGRQTFDGNGTANAHATFVGEVGTGFKALAFERTVGGGEVGTIVANTSSTTYNTSSDYRLKENVDYDWDATTRLKQLKPARFNWISDDTNTLVDGFLAHEVSSIVPEAIYGEKDGMADPILYENGDEIPEGKNAGDVKTPSVPEYQGIDHSKLVPLLVKTIQELEARITTLEG